MLRIFKIVCLIALSTFFQSVAQNERHPVLDKEISIEAHEESLKKILNKISSKTGLHFSYDPTVFNVQKTISVNYQNRKAEEILKDLLSDGYAFKILKNQVIITKPINERKSLDSSSIINEYLKLSGSIGNQFDRSPIPYASISIHGKAIGTITNIDGDFDLKIPAKHKTDTLIVSCLGYTQKFIELDTLRSLSLNLMLRPVDIRLPEIKITVVDPIGIIDKMLENIKHNYPYEPHLMTAFYREVLLQDDKYINVSEAVLNILKASYESVHKEDRVRFLKGRKSREVLPFQWVDFKMQGGPYYITKLDVIKTMDSFLDPEYRNLYDYQTEQLIEYLDRPVYIIRFFPIEKMDFLSYEGKLFIDKETHALVHAQFELSRDGKKVARKSLVRKKPKQFRVRPIDLKYRVSYKKANGKWHLNTAKTSVKFRVRSKRDKINSVFHSVSDLLITDHERTEIRRFVREESLRSSDIFTDIIRDYDPEFWDQFNVIKPNEDLRKALEGINLEKESSLEPKLNPTQILTKKNQEK